MKLSVQPNCTDAGQHSLEHKCQNCSYNMTPRDCIAFTVWPLETVNCQKTPRDCIAPKDYTSTPKETSRHLETALPHRRPLETALPLKVIQAPKDWRSLSTLRPLNTLKDPWGLETCTHFFQVGHCNCCLVAKLVVKGCLSCCFTSAFISSSFFSHSGYQQTLV